MKALRRTKPIDLVAHRYIILDVAHRYIILDVAHRCIILDVVHRYIILDVVLKRCEVIFSKSEVLYRRTRIAVGRKFALHQTRYGLQMHWSSRDKKLTWYNFENSVKLLTIISSIVGSKNLDGSGEFCVCFIGMSSNVKNNTINN